MPNVYQDKLDKELASRPDPAELVKKGILEREFPSSFSIQLGPATRTLSYRLPQAPLHRPEIRGHLGSA